MVKNSGQKKSTTKRSRSNSTKSSSRAKNAQKAVSRGISAKQVTKKNTTNKKKRIDFAKNSKTSTKPESKVVKKKNTTIQADDINAIVDDVLDDTIVESTDILKDTSTEANNPKHTGKIVDPMIVVAKLEENSKEDIETATDKPEELVAKPEKVEVRDEIDETIDQILEEDNEDPEEQDDAEPSKLSLSSHEDSHVNTRPRKREHKVLRFIGFGLLYILRIALTGALLFGAAFALEWIIQYHYNGNNADMAWEFYNEKPALFWFSMSVILAIEGILYGFIRRAFTTVGISFAIVFILDFANTQKFLFRGAPIYPEDFALADQAGSIINFVDPGELARIITLVVLTVLLGIILDIVMPKWFKNCKPKKHKILFHSYMLATRIAIVAVSFSFLAGMSQTITNGVKQIKDLGASEFSELDTYFVSWNQIENYKVNGLVVGFLFNLNHDITETPDGYSEQAIAQIVDKYTAKKNSDTSRLTIAETKYNYVYVLCESFYDTSILRDNGYDFYGEEVMPNLRKIQENSLSGQMFSTDYGGGTATIEYEVITGLTNYWTKVSSPYQNLVTKKSAVPSVASHVKELAGYNTTAVHAYNGSMYKRNQAFPTLGIDSFIDLDKYTHTEKYGESEYINDASSYAEALAVLDSSDGPQFIHLITMQNHMPYNYGEYGPAEFKAANGDEAYEAYLMTLHESDRALGEFIDELSKSNSPTVVVFYGDHAGGIFPEVVGNEDYSVSKLGFLTPYFIYTNFDTEENSTIVTLSNESSDATSLYSDSVNSDLMNWHISKDEQSIIDSSELPTTTPNCLANTMFNRLNLEKPFYFYLLDEVCKEQPILSAHYYGDELPEVSDIIKEYELLTYDIAVGKQYSLNR